VTHTELRTNWLSEIFEETRHASDFPTPLFERKAQRDAIVMAIRGHPQGQTLAATADLDDLVWEALGVAHTWQQQAKQNPHVLMASPAIHASLFILNMEPANKT
jgi:hypothetical protein